jgi:hypothetical protein
MRNTAINRQTARACLATRMRGRQNSHLSSGVDDHAEILTLHGAVLRIYGSFKENIFS